LGVKSRPLAATITNFRTTIGMAVAFSARRSAAPNSDASRRSHLRENSFLGPKRPPESQRCSGGTTGKADSRGVPGYASQRLAPMDNAAQLKHMTIFSNREGLRGSGMVHRLLLIRPVARRSTAVASKNLRCADLH
jgi:hypothetical protein